MDGRPDSQPEKSGQTPGEGSLSADGAATKSVVQATTRTIKQDRNVITKSAISSIGDKGRPRIEKARAVSNVVFSEAADEPGLRFVLISAVLFLLTVLLIVASRLIE